jgi:hypothetical protein
LLDRDRLGEEKDKFLRWESWDGWCAHAELAVVAGVDTVK